MDGAQCDLSKTQEELLSLGLDPQLNSNLELLGEIKHKYGHEVEDFLKKEHPFMERSPDAPVEPKTLRWIKEAIWSVENPRSRYLIMGPDLSDSEAALGYIEIALHKILIISHKTRLVFSNKSDYELFKLVAYENLDKIIKEKMSSYSKKDREKTMAMFYKYFLKDSTVLLGLSSIPHLNPIIVIGGHGCAGNSLVSAGEYETEVTEVVKHLKSMELKSDSIIKLNLCYSGTATDTWPQTEEEIKSLFLSNKLKDLAGEDSSSLLDHFVKELGEQIPDFSGKVQGYLGRVMGTAMSNVLSQNGKILAKANAVKMEGLDWELYLKKEHARIEVKIEKK